MLRYAHPLRRAVAYLVDGVVVAALIFVVITIVTLLLGPTVRLDPDSSDGLVVDNGRSIVNGVLGVLIGAAYFVGAWARSGRTLGNVLLDMQVASVDGERLLSVGRSVVRWVAIGGPLALLSPIVRGSAGPVTALTLVMVVWVAVLLISTIVDRQHRGLHDRIAGSVVLRGPAPRTHRVLDVAR